MTDEIVLYKPNEQFQLEVQLKDDTLWLTQEQIAMLFGTQRPAITKHLNNIYNSGELVRESTCSILERMGNDGKQRYQTQYYNLDAILSVGYRVNSKNATLFRQWANRILKEYILKGYTVNQRLAAVEDRIDRKLQEHTSQIHELQEQVDFFVRTSLPPVEQIFFEGEFFAARVIFEKIVKTATKRVIVIDEYIDAATFEMLDVRAKGVTADIYSNGLHATLRDAHNKTAGVEPIQTHKWRNSSHDRWIIADDTLYHCGHSLKDTGNKLSCIDVITSISADVVLNYVR